MAQYSLPDMEILHLNGIPNKDLPLRAAQLHYLAGWSFAAISRALDGRITARALRYMTAAYTPDFLPPPPTKRFPLPQAPEVRPVLSARHKELLSATEESTIAELAPIARRYRASMSPEHAAAYANRDLTTLVLDCYARGVSISDLARAAGVSHRAMAKRLGKP